MVGSPIHSPSAWPRCRSAVAPLCGRRPCARCFPTLLLAIVLIVGCSHSGDFGAFIVPQVTKYGGHPKITGIIPKLEARWTVKQGANGFTAHVTHVPFSAVDGFMQEVYGAPNISIDTGLEGEQKRVWEAGDIGVSIQLIGHKHDIEMICVGGGGA